MKEIPVNQGKSVRMGLPKTPARWEGSPKYTPITRILLSCGGGMGGSRWYEYVKRIPLDSIKGITVVEDIHGKKKAVNERYVVEMEDFTLVKAVYHSDNPNFQKGLWGVWLLTDDGASVSLFKSFDSQYKYITEPLEEEE